MLYQISNGAVAFGDDVILHSIDFEIRNTEKIAIVGRNGCGKTTLLKLISGEVEMEKLDSDESAFIAKAGNPEIGYLKQIAFDDPDVTLEQEVRKCFVKMDERKAELARAAAELEHDYSDEKVARYTAMEEAFKDDGGYYYEKEYEVMIRKFGFSDDERKKPIRDFSGGQQTKIAFIKLLLSKPDILLLDEPTNHLDVTTIEWLEGYLKSYPKAVVVVSHDRMFLDNVVDVVYEIEYGTARRYPGNYTNFIARKKENYDKQMKDHIAQQKEIERLQRMVTRFKGKPTKTAMAQSKQKAIDRMVIIEAPDKYDNKTFHANFQPEKETGNDVLYTSELAIGYDHPLSVVSLDLKRGEKLGILGGNGLGKSTFLKTIVGKIPALSGEYRFGTNVQIGYFDQQMAMYTSNKTVLDDFWDEYPNLTETEARNALGAFLFSGDDVFKNVNMLSGGEKVRLALCKILKTRPNVLVLDEPTNHMDIVGKETLESMLKDYKGTLIFVSHDRYFVKKVATQLLVFEDGTTNLYQFGYEQYQEKLDREAEESKNVYRGNAIFGGAISQNGSSQTGSDANRSTSQTAAAGNVGESTNANNATGGMAVSSTGKAYYNPGKERSKIQKKVKKAEEDLAVKEAKLDELKADRTDLARRAAERPQKAQSLRAKVLRLISEIAGLGPVNHAALEHLEAVRRTLEATARQVEDLEKGIETLEAAIRKIDAETRGRLRETFEEVNGHFAETFSELFGGGVASLVMSGDDVLNAGVEVKAQPPGKKNAGVKLLSGGEQALAATALVFAIFRLNPAPFCLLDEVDAPLDEANQARLAGLCRRMSSETQFLMITHHRVTMEFAGALVGVTMKEPGVSRVVSVDIENAVRMAN